MTPQPWSASWISSAYDPREDLGVFAFSHTLRLEEKPPASLPIRISADQRYKLYLNGRLVGFGPQRGDPQHWFFDQYDLARALQAGDNHLLVLVWNFGWMAPMAQLGVRTAFLLDAGDVPGLSTPGDWRVAKLGQWGFDMMHRAPGEFYIDVGPGEIVEFGEWQMIFEGSDGGLDWRPPHRICTPASRGAGGGGTPWMLVPRTLPPMLQVERSETPRVRRGFLGDSLNEEPRDGLPLPEEGLVVPPEAPLLLDYAELLCAYPRLRLAAPEGARVSLTYDESLWIDGTQKGHRDEVSGKHSRGYQDVVHVRGDGWFEPLWWRTYRYLLVESDRPVRVLAADAIETGYPLEVESSFEADDSRVGPVWTVSVRTAARCAGESYFDCPYYEQLQYAGDTRIQSLIGYYLGRDRRLQRNAIETLAWSSMEGGLTQSRYPSRQAQVIPPFSLWWVLMLYDQMLYDRVRLSEEHLEIADRALSAFARLMEAEDDAFWNFGDWVPGWRWGVPPGGARAALHALTYELASLAFSKLGESQPLPNGIQEFIGKIDSDWGRPLPKEPRHLLEVGQPTEHAEALFRVWQLLSGRTPDPWPTEKLRGAAQCTYYFSWYKHLADSDEDYLAHLEPWMEMISLGLTTFAENPEPTRSDCHAWSAHPILGFFQLIAGVTSTSPGWNSARIAPRPGSLKRFDAQIAHPDGPIRVLYEGGRLDVETPVPTRLVWKGQESLLQPGRHSG
jgi:alpha-L-rhamnosidase